MAADGASGGTPTLPRNVLGTHHGMLEEQILAVKRRLVMEAGSAIGMLESAIEALVKLDEPAAREVIRRDDEIDKEEVRIEEECLRLLALFNPLARDFRTVAALMRVNADLERVADHATSLCKQTIKLRKFKDAGTHIALPTSLVELGQRVPIQCQTLLRALVNEKADDARAVIMKDKAGTIVAANIRSGRIRNGSIWMETRKIKSVTVFHSSPLTNWAQGEAGLG